MKVPLSWLRELVDITLPLDELVHRLNMSGTEVEASGRSKMIALSSGASRNAV